MLNIDQFESAFRAAAKSRYHHRRVEIRSALVVTDLDEAGARAYAERITPFLSAGGQSPALQAVTGAQCAELGDLIALVKAAAPDLVVTYRCLHSPAWKWPYTVGDHIEVLTQVTDAPVLLLPRIDTGDAAREAPRPPQVIMAMTDHLVGDERLVRWSASLCDRESWLVLAHVEDEAVFERYMGLIGKVPDVDTAVARREIKERLLREAGDWIRSCRDELRRALGDDAPHVEDLVTMGSRLAGYRDLVIRRQAELLVLNTKDDDQLAIHGMAYPLMIELRRVPLLLL